MGYRLLGAPWAGRWPAWLTVWVFLAAGCAGHQVVREAAPAPVVEAPPPDAPPGPSIARGPQAPLPPPPTAPTAGDDVGRAAHRFCATTSDPDQGFTTDTIRVGMYAPLVGPLRAAFESFFRTLRYTLDLVNRSDGSLAVPGLDWGCPTRPGIYGRRIELEIQAMETGSPEELLRGMRKLIDVEKVFMLGFCDPRASNGAAARYQNEQEVPSILCSATNMPQPALAPWTFEPGTDERVTAAIHAGYLVNELGKRRLAVVADPASADTVIPVLRRVAEHLGHPIPDECIVYKPPSEAPGGMHAEVTALRTCYGARGEPDAVIAQDPVLAVFGALAADALNWRAADAGVTWACPGGCWVTVLAELCGDACEGMIADCAVLPCVPWADPEEYAAVRLFRQVRRQHFPSEPEDLVTYGGAALPFALGDFLGLAGPDLSREGFRRTLEGLRRFDPGIGPVLSFSPDDHTGANALWVIGLTGEAPWFEDLSGDFVTLRMVGVPPSVVGE